MEKIAIVTGASSGIGKTITERLKKNEFKVVNWDLRPPQEFSDIPYIKCDVSSEIKVTEAYNKTKEEFGTPYLLVNNSGLQFMSPVEEFPIEKWNLIIDVLLTGTFLCSKAVIKDMKKNSNGRIINISSIHGKLASPFKSAYVSAKHGVLGLAKVLALELAENNITVNSICPGFVETPLMKGQVKEQMALNNLSEDQVLKEIFLKQQSIKKLTSTDQIADLVIYLSSESASTITGEAFNVSGGWGMGL
ncbi:MAG: 3-hydroxybutyrate dehydrogenase [Pseudobdellovibrionaceae bacterium]